MFNFKIKKEISFNKLLFRFGITLVIIALGIGYGLVIKTYKASLESTTLDTS